VSCTALQTAIVRHHKDENKLLKEAVGNDLKGKASMLLYIAAIPLAFVAQGLSYTLYIAVAIIWLVPDRRIEKRLNSTG
jgi:uncharacterized membrane protein